MASRAGRSSLVVSLVLLIGGPAFSGSAQQAAQPGAYCPLPEPGQTPACLASAQHEYQAFFAGVDAGRMPSEVSARVEADLTGAAGIERAYLALSSVSYGYFRLAEQIGVQPDADPVLLARLARWNDLLVGLYGRSQLDPEFRLAIHDMAADLHRHLARQAVAMPASCVGEHLESCGQSADLLRAMAVVDQHTGVRSPLAQLLQRLVGPGRGTTDALEGNAE
jgi:hypothetical protein